MNKKSAIDHFVDRVKTQEKVKTQHANHAGQVASDKSRKLIPLRQFLKKIQDMGLMVYHTERYADRFGNKPPQRFDVYENESSPSFQPGPSIYFDHPAVVEIAIPNEWDAAHPGVVTICCTSYHPESNLLYGPFKDMDDACIALAEFLARSTVSVASIPKP